jgi:hypothetical protein
MDQPQIMWDRPDFPANLIDPHIMSCDAVWTRGRSFSRFEFHRYLPLYSGKNPAEGLTIYCSNNGIVGLRAHFSKSTHSTGSQNGVPIYFPFKSGEEIQYIWYRLGLLSADPPTLVVSDMLSICVTEDLADLRASFKLLSGKVTTLGHISGQISRPKIVDGRFSILMALSQAFFTGTLEERSTA